MPPRLDVHALVRAQAKTRRGHIVNITSTAARRTWPNATAYHASKWGLLGLSHALHVEGREHQIKVTALIAGGWAISQLWLFWVAPLAGGLLGAAIYRFVGGDDSAT